MLLQLQALALGQVVSQNKISTTLYISHNTITAQIFTQLRPKICKMPATAELLLQQMHCRSDFKPNSNSQQKKTNCWPFAMLHRRLQYIYLDM